MHKSLRDPQKPRPDPRLLYCGHLPALAMFPLGTVLLPGMVLPLQIFEPRYKAMLEDCLIVAKSFGVVLIERGNEVGGGDVRTNCGTLAAIMQHSPPEDARVAVTVTGTSRFRVNKWLPDDPYPRAEIEMWPDERADEPLQELYERSAAQLRQVLALAVELGRIRVPVTFKLPDDPLHGSWALAAHSPLGPFDRQRLLEAPDPRSRIELLAKLLDDLDDLLQHDLTD